MADVLDDLKLTIGVPIHDAAITRAAASTGVPTPPWRQGALVSGHVYSLTPLDPGDSQWAANPNGTGHSLVVRIQADMTGATANLDTPPSYYGMIPGNGAWSAWKPIVYLLYRMNLSAGQTVTVILQAFNASGLDVDEHTIGTLTNANNTGSEFKSISLVPGTDAPLASDRKYFRISFRFFANSAGATSFALDQVALGWLPRTTAQEIAFSQWSGAQGWTHPDRSRVELLKPAHGHRVYPYQAAGGATGNLFSFHFHRCDATTKDQLKHLWRVNRGVTLTPNPNPGSVDYYGGWIWPLIVRPNRPGTKELMYLQSVDEEFPIVTDQAARFVEATTFFSGTMSFIEQVY